MAGGGALLTRVEDSTGLTDRRERPALGASDSNQRYVSGEMEARGTVRLQISASDCGEHQFLAPYQSRALGTVFQLRTRLAPGLPFFLFISFLDRFAFSVACCDKILSKINFQLNWLLVDGKPETPSRAWCHLAARGSSVPVSWLGAFATMGQERASISRPGSLPCCKMS